MLTQIDKHLEELLTLWVDGSEANLRRIPWLCGEIVRCATGNEPESFSPDRLQRAGLLAGKAKQRLRTCLEIQARTGAYSTRGDLELAPRIVTTEWEA